MVQKVTNQSTRAQVSFKARYTTVDSLTTLKKRRKNNMKSNQKSILLLAIWVLTLTNSTFGEKSPINFTTTKQGKNSHASHKNKKGNQQKVKEKEVNKLLTKA